MIGLNRTAQSILVILMLIFGALLITFQIVTFTKANAYGSGMSQTDRAVWICELLTALALIGVVIANFFLYWKYIPADAPGCLPFISPYGVIASAVDPGKYAVTPAASYAATTYADAISVYKTSPNGLATGYFAWNGIAVTILNSDAHQLISGAPPGNSWVFQDLSTAHAHS